NAKEDGKNPRIGHCGSDWNRGRSDEQSPQFVRCALRSEVTKSVPRPDRRSECGRIELPECEQRVEAEQAQQTQAILGDAEIGIANETSARGEDIFITSGIVMQCSVSVDRECVDGELAAPGVFVPIASEADN